MPHQMRQSLAALGALPNDAPRGLPGSFYTDPDFFTWEAETILRTNWHCLGRADEIPNVGDFYTLHLLNEPLLIVRDATGINVLSNTCRHRGMPVAQGQGSAKRFVCSYHAWAYGTDGALLSAPRMKNAGFDSKTCALPRFASFQRNGFIYANLADNVPEPDLLALDALLAPYQPETYRHIHTASEVWNTNWKCLVENFMEGYHLSVVHPQTLHDYTPTGLSRKGPSGPDFTAYFANYPDSAAARGIGAPDLSAGQRRRSSLFCVFPTQVASCSATLLVALSLFPMTVDSVRVRWTLSTYGGELDAETLNQRIALWDEVNREDREKLETMQTALASRHATGGPLAGEDYEGTVRDFQTWLARMSANHTNT
jgi:phenylpropionate dioxygenase-like ring-hydroxylating dioxygenase large terminal subunit